MIAPDALDRLADPACAALIGDIACTIEGRPLAARDVERWRRNADASLVSAAVELATARQSLRGRMAAADALWADRAGAAQASDDLSAGWKAQRAAAAAASLVSTGMAPEPGMPWIVDYCCGIGADLAHLALALDGRAEGVDMRPDRAWMAMRNAQAPVHVADVRSWRSAAPLAHIDPSRRDEGTGARRHAWDALEPGPETLAALCTRHAGVMIKLGPGTDVPPDARPTGSELVVISRHGSLTQAVLCTGALAAPALGTDSAHAVVHGRDPAGTHEATRAVLLRAAMPHLEIAGAPTWASGRGDREWPCARGWNRIIAEPDPALERSGLLAQAGRAARLAEVHPGLGLCTDADTACEVAAVDASPWWRAWDVLASGPARLDDVSARLRALNAGIVEVKVRGAAADADAWSRALRSESGEPLTVFVHRTARPGSEAVIGRRRAVR